MKKIIKIGVVMIMLLTGFSFNSGAGLPVMQPLCTTEKFNCGDDTSKYGLVCGNSALSWSMAYSEMWDVICG